MLMRPIITYTAYPNCFTDQMCADLVSIPIAVQAGKLCQGAISASCVSNAPDVYDNFFMSWSVGQTVGTHCVCHLGAQLIAKATF